MSNLKEYSPDQVSNANGLCKLLVKIPEERRDFVSFAIMAYMNGIETGMMYARCHNPNGEKNKQTA